MAWPYGLNVVTVTGLFADAGGNPLAGNAVFQPVVIPEGGTSAQPVIVTDASGHVVIGSRGVPMNLQPGLPPWQHLQPGQVLPPMQTSVSLVATDNSGLSPQNWCYQVTLVTGQQEPDQFTCLLPNSPSTVDFSQLVTSPAGTAVYGYLSTGGGTLSGPVTLGGTPPLQVPGGSAGDVLVSDGSGNMTLDTLAAAGVATTAALTAETTRAETAESTNAAAIATETSRAEMAEALLAPKASPALTGAPTAPTQTTGDTSTKIATDQFVSTAVATETARAEAAEAALVPLSDLPLFAEKPATTENTYYVSAASSASDSNDGLSAGSAKATIAAAITAIGTVTGADGTYNSPGLIILGPGEFTDTTATHIIQGCGGTAYSTNDYPSFEIRGAGRDLTYIQGPDAAAWIQFVNCQRTMVRDLTYSGSPSATGWGIEYNASWNMTAQNWYGSGHGSTGNQTSEVCFGSGASPACAYGIRYTIANADSDGNNDEGTHYNTRFYHCVTPVSVEHAESLQHRFIAPRFEGCGCGLVFHGGSATIIMPVVGNFNDYSGTSGYFLDLQAAIGGTFNGGSTPAAYFHDIEVTNVQSETNAGWVRSNAAATAAGSETQIFVRFTGGNLIGNAANCPTPGMLVDWEANNVDTFLTFSDLYFGASGSLQVNAPASLSRVTFSNCVMELNAFNWAGTLVLNNVWNDYAPTFTGGVLKTSGLGQGTAASRPTAELFGDGFWYATDTGAISASTGGAWSAMLAGTPLPLSGGTLAGWVAPAVVTLTDGSTVAVNAALGNDFRWALTGNGHTLSNPTNPVNGQKIIVQVTQPASGGPYTIAYGTAYLFSAGLPSPTLSLAASYTDLLGFVYNATLGKWLFCAFVNGFA